ncbi:MAG: hypothetical protein NT169_12145 [Chloroflexi bacterium]|nr:hypothetical protein [Chloroflexota bacterium]
MDVIIHQLAAANQADLNRCNNSFTVDAELCAGHGVGTSASSDVSC